MGAFADQLLVLAILINFAALGTSRLVLAVRVIGFQGVVLGVLPALIHPFSWHIAAIVALTVCAKGIIIPWLITNAIHKAEVKRELEPFVGYIPTLVLGALCTALAFVFAKHLPMAPEHQGMLFVPASIATLMSGFLVLTTRRKTISQVLGYLLMENGIFIFGLLLAEAMPAMVEAGAILDLLVGIFVMAIVINQINRADPTSDSASPTILRED